EALRDELAEPLAGRERRAIADLLHGGHEWKGHERDPEHGEAELGACLGVRRDPRRVVVGGTGDEAGPERAKVDAPCRSGRAGLGSRTELSRTTGEHLRSAGARVANELVAALLRASCTDRRLHVLLLFGRWEHRRKAERLQPELSR